MKKYVFALVLVSFTTVCMSQDIRYGVRGALNISNLDFDPEGAFVNQHRNGFAFGGFAEFEFAEKTSLLLEIQWSAEGGKNESIRADYIKLPIFLRFSLSDRFLLGVGPQAALKTWKDRDGFATFAASGVVGLEYMITDELFVDARATYGFTNILDQDLSDAKANNHLLQFGFGIKL
ncbi:porin family protein [Winogradskyella sp. R77965]|uniref:porin family protein n=1 Tax=Winogradskyella sp. R77965 TaxID=3093872 RepID=UPI0037DCC35A